MQAFRCALLPLASLGDTESLSAGDGRTSSQDGASWMGAAEHQLEHALMPLVTFLVLPVFALANAGVDLGGGVGDVLGDRVFLGVVLGLFFGKQIGVTGAAWLAVRLKIADLPQGITWSHIYGAALLSGIGVTMSLLSRGWPSSALSCTNPPSTGSWSPRSCALSLGS